MKFHSTVLFVKDITQSKNFYKRLFAFNVAYDFGNNLGFEEVHSLWEIMPKHEIAQKLSTSDKSNRFELYFEHANIDEFYKLLKHEGVVFLHELKEESWGQRTVRFFDPDGHLVEVGEPLEVFIQNLSKQGLSQAEIESKTGVPGKNIAEILNR